MIGGQLVHQYLKQVPISSSRRGQQLLHQLEHRHDVPALSAVALLRRQVLRQQQNHCRQQTFRRIVKIGVLASVRILPGVDDGLGENLGVLLRLGPAGQIVFLHFRFVHVAVDEGQQIVPVRVTGVAQVDDRYVVTVILPGNGAVVPGQVALGVQSQKAHAAGTGVFQVGVEEKSGLAHAGSANHETVDVIGIHQGRKPFSLAPAAQHKALLPGEILALPPLAYLKGNPMVGGADLRFRGPAGRAVLAVAHGLALDAAELEVALCRGEQHQHYDQRSQTQKWRVAHIGAGEQIPPEFNDAG